MPSLNGKQAAYKICAVFEFIHLTLDTLKYLDAMEICNEEGVPSHTIAAALEAMRSQGNALLEVVGEFGEGLDVSFTNQWDAYREAVRRHGLEAVLNGEVPEEEAAAALSTAD